MDWLNVTFGPVDPSRVHAVVVGLEKYADTAWNLRGPHADATRFSRWLADRGVPAEQIHWWCSTLPRVTDCSPMNGASDMPITARETKDLDSILETFMTTLSRVEPDEGDLLWVFWGGHGAMDGERRVLYGPSAGPDVAGALVLDELAALLSSDRIPAFSRQLIVVDACAALLTPEERSTVVSHHIKAGGPRADIRQFFLFSTARGQYAGEGDPCEGFCGALVDWLEDGDNGGLAPNLLAMSTHVRTHLRSVADAGGPWHEPALFHLHYGPDLNLREDLPSRWPEPDPVHLNMLKMRLRSSVPGQVDRITELVARECAITIPSSRIGHEDTLATVLLRVPRAAAALSEELRRNGYDQAARGVTTCDVPMPGPALLSPSEHRTLYDLLGAVEPLQGWQADACLKAALHYHSHDVLAQEGDTFPYPGAAPAHPEGFATWARALCIHLETHGAPDPSRVPYLLRFTEHLAVVTPEHTKSLHQWGDQVADRLGIDTGVMKGQRRQAQDWEGERSHDPTPPRVVVRLRTERHPSPMVAGRYSSSIWIDRGCGELDLFHRKNGQSDAEVVRDINIAVEHVLGRDSTDHALIECLVPFAEFTTRPDTWDAAPSTESPLPQILGVDHPVVLRYEGAHPATADARSRSLKDRWHTKYEDLTVIPLPPAGDPGTRNPTHASYGALRARSTPARVKILAAPEGRLELVRLAAEVGYPAIVWDPQTPGPLPEDHFDALPLSGNLAELPESLRRYRAEALADPTAHPGEFLLLLEDPTRALPETLVQTALPDMLPE